MLNRALTATAVLAAIVAVTSAHLVRKAANSPRALVVIVCLAYFGCAALMLLVMPDRLAALWSRLTEMASTAWSAIS
ncbi:hypothetical protein [Glycomyces sp. MUSA5-2]|uniref:hypothetical protein n=1 Tax=Glycomyces sp. MUSA5-2 TaxID=2053002 RepID=UPI00300A2EB6